MAENCAKVKSIAKATRFLQSLRNPDYPRVDTETCESFQGSGLGKLLSFAGIAGILH
jgi:hypothetical protein